MYMRGKLFILGVISACVICLCGCTGVINSSADEIKQYRWQVYLDNGNTVSLSFDDGKADFCAVTDDYSLELNGLCILTDNTIIICDEDSGTHYSFVYTLFGDRVELNFNGSVISLKKADDS